MDSLAEPGKSPIVVVGHGILGATTALRLAYAGRSVVVVGSTPTTTNLAFGWLGGHQVANPLRHALNRLSSTAWQALLDTHLGRDGYLPGGCLMYAADESTGGLGRLETAAGECWDRGFPARRLSSEQVAGLVPSLAGRTQGGLLMPDDAVIDAKWAARRALERAHEFGADVRQGEVVAFTRHPDGSVASVMLADGSSINCSGIVLAAGGKGNHHLGGLLGLSLPIKGVWGMQLTTRPLSRRLAPGIALLKHYSVDCVATAGITYGQFPDNSFCINERLTEGFDLEARLHHWLAHFADVWPELREAQVARMTKTVRWVAEDEGHVCGFAPAPNTNVYVMLPYSDGISMAPLFSEMAATELCGGTTGLLAQCLPGRFERARL